jgi:hypothetical protein
MLEQQERFADMMFGDTKIDFESLPPEVEFRPLALAQRGFALLATERLAEARTILEEAATLCERSGYFTGAHQARLDLASSLLPDDTLGAYQNLLRALSAQDEIRGKVLESDQRISVGGAYANTYSFIVWLLLAASHAGEEGWPKRPAAEAFDWVEQARSRVLLETLGENLLVAPHSAPDSSIREEQEARAAYHREQIALDAAPAEERQAALGQLRSARERLERAWLQLERTGPGGAEYAHLHRGSPRSFDEIKALFVD